MAQPNVTASSSPNAIRAIRYVDVTSRVLLAATSPGSAWDYQPTTALEVNAAPSGSQDRYHYWADRDVQIQVASGGTASFLYVEGVYNGQVERRIQLLNVDSSAAKLTSFGAFDNITRVWQPEGAPAIGANVSIIAGKALCAGASWLYLPSGGSVTGRWSGGESIAPTDQPEDAHITIPSLAADMWRMDIVEISAAPTDAMVGW